MLVWAKCDGKEKDKVKKEPRQALVARLGWGRWRERWRRGTKFLNKPLEACIDLYVVGPTPDELLGLIWGC